jgi:hypothetical protein
MRDGVDGTDGTERGGSMVTSVMAADDSESGGRGRPRLKGPSPRQEEILSTYADNPNAAAVGRALGTNERHVRRVVEEFEGRLDELLHERDQERRQRSRAREAKVHAWADASLDESLRRLDSLAVSANESIALRAIKMKLDLALRVPTATSRLVDTEISRALENMERDLARRIAQIEFGAPDEDADHG